MFFSSAARRVRPGLSCMQTGNNKPVVSSSFKPRESAEKVQRLLRQDDPELFGCAPVDPPSVRRAATHCSGKALQHEHGGQTCCLLAPQSLQLFVICPGTPRAHKGSSRENLNVYTEYQTRFRIFLNVPFSGIVAALSSNGADISRNDGFGCSTLSCVKLFDKKSFLVFWC